MDPAENRSSRLKQFSKSTIQIRFKFNVYKFDISLVLVNRAGFKLII